MRALAWVAAMTGLWLGAAWPARAEDLAASAFMPRYSGGLHGLTLGNTLRTDTVGIGASGHLGVMTRSASPGWGVQAEIGLSFTPVLMSGRGTTFVAFGTSTMIPLAVGVHRGTNGLAVGLWYQVVFHHLTGDDDSRTELLPIAGRLTVDIGAPADSHFMFALDAAPAVGGRSSVLMLSLGWSYF
jgi:hypothetical protein